MVIKTLMIFVMVVLLLPLALSFGSVFGWKAIFLAAPISFLMGVGLGVVEKKIKGEI